jgi:hypothetical protein
VGNSEQPLKSDLTAETQTKGWIKPEIVSFKPIEAAEGISYNPTDGISNLTI